MDNSLEVFVLSYNRPDELKKSIHSLLNQTIDGFDIIVLDNASECDMTSVVNSFGNSRVRLIQNKTNINSFNNFCKAIQLASKEYLVIFHDDDCMSPQLLEVELGLFKKHPETGFIATGVTLVSDKDKMMKFETFDPANVRFEMIGANAGILDAYFSSKVFGFSSIMYRTNLVKTVNPHPERYAQVIDRAFMLNLSIQAPVIFLQAPNYNALQHANQDSYKRSWDFRHDLNLINLYLQASKESKKEYLQTKIIKSLAQLYSLRSPIPSIRSVFTTIEFVTFKNKLTFFMYLPFFVLRYKTLSLIRSAFPLGYNSLVKLKRKLKN
jgi:glycosyltransferase involved in cell wall biosynthesis